MRASWAMAFLLCACGSEQPPEATLASETDQAKRAVLTYLKDPDSARFGAIERSSDGESFCGTVNARNGYGGFTGMQSFVYSPDRAGDEFYLYEGDNQQRRIVAAILEERGCPLTEQQARWARAHRILTGELPIPD